MTHTASKLHKHGSHNNICLQSDVYYVTMMFFAFLHRLVAEAVAKKFEPIKTVFSLKIVSPKIVKQTHTELPQSEV